MMKRTIAIPVRLLKPLSQMTNAEKLELKKFGDQPLDEAEVAAREAEEQVEADRVAAYELVRYRDERRPLLEQLDGDGKDAMRKAIAALATAAGVDMPAEFVDYLEQVDAIKQQFPKPETE